MGFVVGSVEMCGMGANTGSSVALRVAARSRGERRAALPGRARSDARRFVVSFGVVSMDVAGLETRFTPPVREKQRTQARDMNGDEDPSPRRDLVERVTAIPEQA